MVSMIISGGQTGVDRAALDFALGKGINCGGYCPAGRRAEDGVIHEKYPLKECRSSNYEVRTENNILESDGTLIITMNGLMDKGTRLTKALCKKFNKPFFVAEVNENPGLRMQLFLHWSASENICKLNIAGPRESSQPGIYRHALLVMEELFWQK